ncbi:MAG TPA: protein adenylyltransferase SelO family protein, partial [Beijerinckiaceae bacterium]|nr:protein adenylyltransferase SelO family protein [Beijerinckiaceae bacterium]
ATCFESAYHAGLRRKLGLAMERDGDAALAGDLLSLMTENQADFTLTFRHLADAAAAPEGDEAVRNLFVNPQAYDGWAARWRERLAQEPQDPAERRTAMRAVNPAFIPRNHRVEAMIQAAVQRDEFVPFEELLRVLSRPYEDQPEFARYAVPPEAHERVRATFCGT